MVLWVLACPLVVMECPGGGCGSGRSCSRSVLGWWLCVSRGRLGSSVLGWKPKRANQTKRAPEFQPVKNNGGGGAWDEISAGMVTAACAPHDGRPALPETNPGHRAHCPGKAAPGTVTIDPTLCLSATRIKSCISLPHPAKTTARGDHLLQGATSLPTPLPGCAVGFFREIPTQRPHRA